MGRKGTRVSGRRHMPPSSLSGSLCAVSKSVIRGPYQTFTLSFAGSPAKGKAANGAAAEGGWRGQGEMQEDWGVRADDPSTALGNWALQ